MPTSNRFHQSPLAATLLAVIGAVALAACSLLVSPSTFAQSESASVSGRVTDSSNGVIPEVEIEIRNTDTGVAQLTKTNSEGFYTFPALKPGHYLMSVRKEQFQTVTVTGITLNVQDNLSRNFAMQIGSSVVSVTVRADDLHINTTDASVSTVVDHNFAENLPLQGRSFQSLIFLTPGTVAVSAGGFDSGQFSVNGQRAAANYWTVDGVSANAGTNTAGLSGNQAAGAVATASVLGGTNSLVSVDALQEFRIQTSTFAPEYGRTPGAQISIVTRSGTNSFHGTAFDYLRNDVLDANNWFNGVNILNPTPLPKARERQNDFGGVLGGPILKNRTFFFFSYEGLRLRLPNTGLSTVPDAAARKNATPAMQPYLNAFPLDPKQPDLGNGIAQFNSSFSNPASQDAYSLRVDHKATEKLSIFARYNYSPSQITERGTNINALSSLDEQRSTAQQLTIGSTWLASKSVLGELRFNYSRTRGASKSFLDDFGGAIPLSALPFPSPFDARNGQLALDNFALQNSFLVDGAGTDSIQRQLNIVGAISVQFRSHHFKAGIDYRRLTPLLKPSQYSQFAGFLNIADEQNGAAFESGVATQTAEALLFRNISAFVQDSWFVSPRLTATYGLRWDADLVPSTTSGPQLPSITGFTSLSNLSGIGLAPAGTPPFRNTFGNIAPRLGVAYQLRQRPDWGTVLRAGAGVFYDLATSETVNLIAQTGYPFAANFFTLGGTFPFAPDVAAPPPITPPSPTQPQGLGAFVPNFKLPYTVQWNVAIEQGLGPQQSVSLSYVGASGQRLVAPTTIASPNASLALLLLATNAADSNYNSLQLQMQRRLVKSLQVLASYTWSHSIDTASAGSVGVGSNIAASDQGGNRGPSDFDIRHAFSAGLTYAIPSLTRFRALKEITNGWSLQSIIQAQTARPISILDGAIARLANGSSANVRPDVTPGIPLYLYGPQFPGGKAFNNTPGAVAGGCPDGSVSVGPFCPPPLDNNGNAIRQGDFPRNALRGFGFFQWDMGIHRDFAILESLKLQLRAELFNVLNHPNFAPPISDITAPNFGLSNQILAQYLAGGFGLGGGSFSSLYQSGGPRSIQLALKLTF